MTNTTRRGKRRSHSWVRQLLIKRYQITVDLLVIATAFTLAYLLRFDFAIPRREIYNASRQLPWVILIQFGAMIFAGIYSFIWRFIGMSEVKAFIKAAIYSMLPILLLRLMLPNSVLGVPLSVIIIDTVLAFGGVVGVRVLWRAVYERYRQHGNDNSSDATREKKRPILLIGAGRAGKLVANEIKHRRHVDLEIKGFVDDDPYKQQSVIHGIKVLGMTEDLPWLVREWDIDHVVISIAQASRKEFRRILDICEQIPVRVRTIPSMYEILQGKVKVSRIRDLQIEDLLGREPVNLAEESVERFLAGKVIMVTGAGGSIGSELARQVARYQPSSLLLVERAEFALFNTNFELQEAWPNLSIVPLVADVGNEARMQQIFSTHRPQVVIHAAAHKHVPMMETNITEAMTNNVLATHVLGELAGRSDVEVFVLISTDKAVRPTSVMGASKRVAELVVQDLQRRYSTRFVAVRFGNVIGSAGSVIPIFREQIRKGGPVTVTHPDMVRYFMTIPEAAQLVLQASAMGEGGEIFILDMGDPVRILDLAKDVITLSGLKPFEDIDIVCTGVRPGEKLFEELEIKEEYMRKTRHPKIFIGKIAAYPEEKVSRALEQLAVLSEYGNEQELYTVLTELLPEARLNISRAVTPATEQALPPPVGIGAYAKSSNT